LKSKIQNPKSETNSKSQDQGTDSWYRLFIAVFVPEEVKSEIEKAQIELRRALPEGCVRWTKRQQLHLTLKFLGNVGAERIESLAGLVRGVCRQFAPLELRAKQVGFFPEHGFPRVVWVGIDDRQRQLLSLQREIERASRDFAPEEAPEKFTGHVTLGRVKQIRRVEAEILARAKSEMADRIFGEWTATQVDLMRSELEAAGARHESLAAMRLGELA
jgi:2'-5' RNA ligase